MGKDASGTRTQLSWSLSLYPSFLQLVEQYVRVAKVLHLFTVPHPFSPGIVRFSWIAQGLRCFLLCCSVRGPEGQPLTLCG